MGAGTPPPSYSTTDFSRFLPGSDKDDGGRSASLNLLPCTRVVRAFLDMPAATVHGLMAFRVSRTPRAECRCHARSRPNCRHRTHSRPDCRHRTHSRPDCRRRGQIWCPIVCPAVRAPIDCARGDQSTACHCLHRTHSRPDCRRRGQIWCPIMCPAVRPAGRLYSWHPHRWPTALHVYSEILPEP